MEEDYNWELIIKAALPIALIEAYVFYANIIDIWRWVILIIGLALSGTIIYMKDKRKSNIFTAIGIIFLAALIVRLLRNFGIV